MMRWLPMMATVAWGLSPGPWLEGPGPGEVTYYFNRSILMTTQKDVYISIRKFINGGAAGHSSKEGHHVGGPWGTKGRHHHDSKHLQHSPGGIRLTHMMFKTNFQVSFPFSATPTIACSAGLTAMIFWDTSINLQITMGRLDFGPIFIMIENSLSTINKSDSKCCFPSI